MVKTILHQCNSNIPVATVHARRGKTARAEPVAALYAQGRVQHMGASFAALEDELCMLGTESLRKSPDRADALVWAVTDLLLRREQKPTIRGI